MRKRKRRMFEIVQTGPRSYKFNIYFVWMSKFGWLVAFVLGTILNNSFLWGFTTMFLGWIYAIYALITRHDEFYPAIQSFFGV